MSKAPVQLSLGVALRDDATFVNYLIADDAGELIVNTLQQVALGNETASHVLWGARGCGLTHLMQAVCHNAFNAGRHAQYLPMGELLDHSAQAICDGLEQCQIVCVDGVDAVCGNPEWELALFHLFNKLRDANNTMLLSSRGGPSTLPISLADLKSRVLGCVIFHVRNLSDTEKQEALILRARARGMQMPPDVAKYILKRASRDMNNLFHILNRLDEASMQQHRKLTIPFVKQTFGF